MRICFFGNFTKGGTEKATFLLANELSKLHKYKIFVLNASFTTTFYLNENITYSSLFYKHSKITLAKKNFEVFKYLKKNCIDVIISIEALTGLSAIIPSKLSNVKLIIAEHANYYQKQGSKWIQYIRQLELVISNYYIVLTKRDLRNFKRNFKIIVPITYIYNIKEEVKDVKYNLNSKKIISAGHIRPIKNFSIIPDVASIVFEKYSDWTWEIYGECKGQEYKELKNKIKILKLEKHVLLKGRIENMSMIYTQAAMYVLTSLHEGLPMVLLEAKAHKLPIVSFDIETGPDEIIDDKKNGFLIEFNNVEKMSNMICLLIQNPALRKDFSNQSQLNIERFNKKIIVEKWEKVFNNI